MKRIFLIVFMMLLYAFPCFAESYPTHLIYRSMNASEVTECVNEVHDYFYRTYGLILHRNLEIFVADNDAEYVEYLQRIRGKISDYEVNTAGMSPVDAHTKESKVIFLNGQKLKGMSLFITLAHEMVHQYQFEYFNDITDVVMMEGWAYILGARIAGLKMPCVNHNIGYAALRDADSFKNYMINAPQDTIEELCWHASQVPFESLLK